MIFGPSTLILVQGALLEHLVRAWSSSAHDANAAPDLQEGTHLESPRTTYRFSSMAARTKVSRLTA